MSVLYLQREMEILIIVFCAFFAYNCCFGYVPKLHESNFDKTISSRKLLLAFIRPNEECGEACEASLTALDSVGLASSFLGLYVVEVVSPSRLKAFQSPDEPKLFYYREGIPLVFESDVFDVEEISSWIAGNQDVVLKKLNDETFEHLTQASSGSTTGDWFILFYSEKCDQYIPLWETLALRLKQHKIVAIINIDTSPLLKARFSIKKCPEAIFLRHGRMYHYTLPFSDLTSLVNFAEGWYKNVPYHNVPAEPTPFDNLTSNIAAWMKDHPMALVAVCVVMVSLLLLLFLRQMFATSKPKLF